WDVEARRFDIIDAEVQVIRHIFDWYVNGNLGITPIATRLNQEGYRTRPKRTKKDDEVKPRNWHISAVYNILKERRYTSQDDHFTFPKIIDKALFDTAQRKLKQARPIRRNPGRWLLQGYCVCGLCGHGLACRQKYEGGPRRYECRGTMKMSHVDGSAKCTLKSVPADKLEKFIWQRFAQVASDDKLLRQSIEQALKQLESRESQLNKTGSIEAELMDIEARKERLWTAYEYGGMPEERFLSRVGALKAKEDKLQRRREQLDPTSSYELSKLEDQITTVKQILEDGKITIGNSGVGGLTFDPDKPLTYMHDLHDLLEGKAGEEKSVPSANWEFRNAENAVNFSCSAEWLDWANKEEKFRITVVVLPDRIEIKGVIPDQVIQRRRDQVFYSG
ncbi:recombinase family protein, partial [Chloroflexota bacterium]